MAANIAFVSSSQSKFIASEKSVPFSNASNNNVISICIRTNRFSERIVNQNDQTSINKSNEFLITSEKHRTQHRNLMDAYEKLQQIVDRASIEPKDREAWQGIGEKGKQLRRTMKAKRKSRKKFRSKNFKDY